MRHSRAWLTYRAAQGVNLKNPIEQRLAKGFLFVVGLTYLLMLGVPVFVLGDFLHWCVGLI